MAPRGLGVLVEQGFRGLAGLACKYLVLLQVGVAQHRQAALALAEEFAGSAQFEVVARDFETVALFEDHLEPRARGLRERRRIEQDADAVARAAPDAAAQLVQLRKAEALG